MPCVSTAFVAKTPPSPRVAAAVAANTPRFPCGPQEEHNTQQQQAQRRADAAVVAADAVISAASRAATRERLAAVEKAKESAVHDWIKEHWVGYCLCRRVSTAAGAETVPFAVLRRRTWATCQRRRVSGQRSPTSRASLAKLHRSGSSRPVNPPSSQRSSQRSSRGQQHRRGNLVCPSRQSLAPNWPSRQTSLGWRRLRKLLGHPGALQLQSLWIIPTAAVS